MRSSYHRSALPKPLPTIALVGRTPAGGRRGGASGPAPPAVAPLAVAFLAALVVAVVLACAPAGARAAAAAAEGRRATPTLAIQGAGYGHGVGMSQEGALGYAQHGYTYEEILAHYYTGTSLGTVSRQTKVGVLLNGRVRRIPLETYVRGVVGAEMPGNWPEAALEAQAVASRTYALTDHAGGSRFDVYADGRSQVYLGTKAQTARTDAAVATTAGQVVTYEGRPAITYFFASSGGATEDVQNAFPGAAPEPWLVGVRDPYDQGPEHSWSVSMSFAAAAARLGGLVKGAFRGIEVLRRGWSPRIVSAWVEGSRGRTKVGGLELASRLGLGDTWAYFSVKTAHGVRAEPDLSRWTAPPERGAGAEAPTAGGTPGGAPGGAGAGASAATGPEGGTSAGAASAGPSGGTASG